MARYVNIYKERNVVVSQAYDCDFGRWICEHEFMVAIETNDGRLVMLPVMYDSILNDCTADEYLKEAEDEKMQVIMNFDCTARDELIKKGITEWICNEGAVSNSPIIDAICHVVSTLERNGMWKDEYAESIDIKKIKEELGEEEKCQ